MAKKTNLSKFNFAVGRYWNGDSGAVGCYMIGSEVHFGTLKEAKDYREYCNNQATNDEEEKNYRIFMLVELPV